MTDTPKRILIIRLSAIGDIVMAAPVARALKQAYPHATIDWLTQPECASLVCDDASIRKVLTWPRKQWAKHWQNRQFGALWRAVNGLKTQLRSEQYDLAIDLQGLLKSGLLTALSGAQHTVSLGGREGSRWFVKQVIARDEGNQDLIGSEYRHLITTLTGSSDYTLDLPVSAQDRRDTAVMLAESGLNTPFIALCPFTTRPQKHWINAHWQTLIDDLLALGGYPLAILGGPDDSTAAATLIGDRPVVNLAGKTNLQQAGVVIKHAACVVGVDTGLTHMGHAAETPTIAIFGSTRPYLDAQKPASVIIYQDRHCSPCKRRPTCDGRFDCMHEITPAQVLTQVQYALTSNAVAK